MMGSNATSLTRMKLVYPPLLMHGLPTLLAILGWASADRVARAGVLVGLACLAPLWFLGSNFHEVRAQVPLTILLLPTALFGLQRIVGRGAPRGERAIEPRAALPGC